MAVNVSFGATTGALESGVSRAKSALNDFMSPLSDRRTPSAVQGRRRECVLGAGRRRRSNDGPSSEMFQLRRAITKAIR
jgi:hypothetical protein